MKVENITYYNFPKAEKVVVCGDIHGDYNMLVNKMCVQYGLTHTLLIVAGDCGFGFENKGYYDNIVRRNNKRMAKADNWIVFVRGNHDNPAYFDGSAFNYERFKAMPNYSVIQACGHNILCVGGAISVDRQYRLDYIAKQRIKPDKDNPFARNVYWSNEASVFEADKLAAITENCAIDVVVSHTAPSFCELKQKDGLKSWADNDKDLLFDVSYERKQMDDIYEYLVSHDNVPDYWFYGHFHQSWHKDINGTTFLMLDIMEIEEMP